MLVFRTEADTGPRIWKSQLTEYTEEQGKEAKRHKPINLLGWEEKSQKVDE